MFPVRNPDWLRAYLTGTRKIGCVSVCIFAITLALAAAMYLVINYNDATTTIAQQWAAALDGTNRLVFGPKFIQVGAHYLNITLQKLLYKFKCGMFPF